MSLVTTRQTFIGTSGTAINVEDFDFVVVYKIGSFTVSKIFIGFSSPSGLDHLVDITGLPNPGILSSTGNQVNYILPTPTVPIRIDTRGITRLAFSFSATGGGENGLYAVGNISKVSNE